MSFYSDMQQEKDHPYKKLDDLIGSAISFALYRLPGDTSSYFIAQVKGSPKQLSDYKELNNKEGFILAPFAVSDKNPILVIEPQERAYGDACISDLLEKLHPRQSFRPVSSGNGIPAEDPYSIYCRAFNLFKSGLSDNQFSKLVLSKSYRQPYPPDFSWYRTFVKAEKKYPEAFVYLCYTPQSGTWFGASPEVLLSGKDSVFETTALAGTMTSEDLLDKEWNDKNKNEQALVAQYIRDCLTGLSVDWSETPTYPAQTGNLVHLKTDFRFTYPESGKMGDLIQTLHPTPAVCGIGKEEAYRFIIQNEGYDRGYYAGFAGEISSLRPTNLYVNLRCLSADGSSMVFYAGGGIMPQSDKEQEWEETERKLQSLLSIIKTDNTHVS